MTKIREELLTVIFQFFSLLFKYSFSNIFESLWHWALAHGWPRVTVTRREAFNYELVQLYCISLHTHTHM